MKLKSLKLGTLIKYAFLVALAIVTIYPVLITIMGSFKTTREILLGGINPFPQSFNFENYTTAWEMANFKTYTFNSAYYSFFVVIFVILSSTMAGYVYSRGQFVGKKLVFAILTGTMFVALGTSSLYPTLKIAQIFGLNSSLWGVIIIHAFGINMGNILLVKGFVNTIPNAVFEAATIDGCGFARSFYYIVFPLLKPMIATLTILSFKSAWNEYLLPMVFTLSNPSQAPLAVGLATLKNSSGAATNWGIIFAGATMSLLPILVVYCVFNRFFVEGMNAGAVKE